MVLSLVCAVGMDQDAEIAVIEHQPRHEGREQGRPEGDLEHRLAVRADRGVEPPPQSHAETLGGIRAQPLGLVPRDLGVVIDVGMVAHDLVDRARRGVRHLPLL